MRKGNTHIIHLPSLVMATTMACCLIFAGMQNTFAQMANPANKEYKLKAVFLFNFTKFIEWPASAFSSPGAPFVIGIVGEDPFGISIDEVVQNERVGSHPLVVQRFHEAKEVTPCHILFLHTRDPEKIREWLPLAGHNTLTVSDADMFVKMGGMIRFITDNNRIRLLIFPEAAKNADLQISSKLLRVSDIYDPKIQR